MAEVKRVIGYRAEVVRGQESAPDADGTTEKPKSAIFNAERRAMEWVDREFEGAQPGDRVVIYRTVEEMVVERKK